MRRTQAIILAAFGLAISNYSFAQTGQVPKSYSGQQSKPATINQPRPTGQIAPQVTGQPLGSLPQKTTTSPTQQVSREVQDLGFEPKTNTQDGQVPKVNTDQDQRTMPERYQPGQPTRAQRMVIETEVQSETQNVNVSVQPTNQGNTQTTVPATNQQNANTARPVQNSTKSQQQMPVQQGNTQSNTQQPATAKP